MLSINLLLSIIDVSLQKISSSEEKLGKLSHHLFHKIGQICITYSLPIIAKRIENPIISVKKTLFARVVNSNIILSITCARSLTRATRHDTEKYMHILSMSSK